MLRPSPALVLLVVLSGAGAAACTTIDLGKTLEVTDVQTGWYDNGIKDGMNHLVPQVTFRLKNVSPESINSVQMTIAFWMDGADGMMDEVLKQGIGSDGVAPGATSEPIQARSPVGYTYAGPRADALTNSKFVDVTARVFAKRGGKIFKMGEYRVERKLIPTDQRDAPRP
jgi:hypothetical protein